METLERILNELPFFDGLDPELLSVLVGCATNVRFKPGEFVFREGAVADHFYLVREGRVALEIFTTQKGPVALGSIGPGEPVGWSWLIPPYMWHSDGRAVEPTRAIALDGKCLREKCERDHSLGYELMKRFAHVMERRLHASRLQVLDLYSVHD